VQGLVTFITMFIYRLGLIAPLDDIRLLRRTGA
jgi:hypothetical protein